MCNHFPYIENNMLKKFVIRANKKMWQNLYNMPSKASHYIATIKVKKKKN